MDADALSSQELAVDSFPDKRVSKGEDLVARVVDRHENVPLDGLPEKLGQIGFLSISDLSEDPSRDPRARCRRDSEERLRRLAQSRDVRQQDVTHPRRKRPG